jgi:hypothetical protein
MRERDGDRGGAEALYRQAADRGDSTALWELARMRERDGDPEGAELIQRFGLTDDGSPAGSLEW